MNELRIIRGRDILLKADHRELFGVTEVSAVERPEFHEVHEYLSTVPVARVPQGTVHRLELKMLSLFDDQIPRDRSFTLSVIGDEYAYIYENCRLTECRYDVKGSTPSQTVFLIKSEKMTQQEVEDDE